MNVVRLGTNGRLTLPRAVVARLGLKDDDTLWANVTDEGAIWLRPAAGLPIETYSNARVRDFEDATQVDDALRARVAEWLERGSNASVPVRY